jgi:hypothetical protein
MSILPQRAWVTMNWLDADFKQLKNTFFHENKGSTQRSKHQLLANKRFSNKLQQF